MHMEEMDLIKSFIGIASVDDYEKWNDEVFGHASEEECDLFWEWADSALFNQIWDTLAQKLRTGYECNDQQQIECGTLQFEFVPDMTQEHIIKYFCGDDLACSLILTAPLEFDVEEIEYEDNILKFSNIVFDC